MKYSYKCGNFKVTEEAKAVYVRSQLAVKIFLQPIVKNVFAIHRNQDFHPGFILAEPIKITGCEGFY